MTVAAFTVPQADRGEGGPLTAQHHRELAQARQNAKAINKAARVANFNGWATAIVALLSAPFALFSISGALVFIGLSVIAYNELRGRNRLLQFDRSAATFLGWNQLALLAIIVIYCLWAIQSNFSEAKAVTAELGAYADVQAVLGSPEQIEKLAREVVLLFYGSVIAASVVFQGLTALYYFSRRKHIDAYIAGTPEWIRQLQSSVLTV
ncbi:MAG TPA: hypothetical protein VHK01_11825 [Lacipirellulaceae bacterium]|jgi:hypothetical protein|nr:hypothetical protein [Lacipirellulaceae bacterium]